MLSPKAMPHLCHLWTHTHRGGVSMYVPLKQYDVYERQEKSSKGLLYTCWFRRTLYHSSNSQLRSPRLMGRKGWSPMGPPVLSRTSCWGTPLNRGHAANFLAVVSTSTRFHEVPQCPISMVHISSCLTGVRA